MSDSNNKIYDYHCSKCGHSWVSDYENGDCKSCGNSEVAREERVNKQLPDDEDRMVK